MATKQRPLKILNDPVDVVGKYGPEFVYFYKIYLLRQCEYIIYDD